MSRRGLETVFVMVVVAILSFTIFYFVVIYPVEGPLKGEPPKFSVLSLVDNGENDYIDIRLVERGTGDYVWEKWRPRTLQIYIKGEYTRNAVIVKDNLLRINGLEIGLHEKFDFYNDIARIYFYSNIVEKNKSYHIMIFSTLSSVPGFRGKVTCV